jgi:hypothetical protein
MTAKDALIFGAAWMMLGAIASVISLRRQARFERALRLKYPTVANSPELPPKAYVMAFFIGWGGPFAILSLVTNDLRSQIAGEPYWSDAR